MGRGGGRGGKRGSRGGGKRSQGSSTRGKAKGKAGPMKRSRGTGAGAGEAERPAKVTRVDRDHMKEFGDQHPVNELEFEGDASDASDSESGGRREGKAFNGRATSERSTGAVDGEIDSDSDGAGVHGAYAKLLGSLSSTGRHRRVEARARLGLGPTKLIAGGVGVGESAEAPESGDESDTDDRDRTRVGRNGQDVSAEGKENGGAPVMGEGEDNSASGTESESEDGSNNEDDTRTTDTAELSTDDPFDRHFNSTECTEVDAIAKDVYRTERDFAFHTAAYSNLRRPLRSQQAVEEADLSKFHIKERLREKFMSMQANGLTNQQRRLLEHVSEYRDVVCAERNHSNESELVDVYALHALNHTFKTRDKIIKNNERLRKAQADGKDIEEFRDQGFTRPKVLILLPMRNTALRVVDRMLQMCVAEKDMVHNKTRFYEDFGVEEETENREGRPLDFQKTFDGNNDDHFVIGMSVTRKAVKLYASMNSSDIIIASPLALRMKADGEDKDIDYLSSIEVVIVDQAEVAQMQNWENITSVFKNLNMIPKESGETDFSRLREFYLNGMAKTYRHTLVFSAYMTPEINSLMTRYCKGFEGKVKTLPHYKGTIGQVVRQTQQTFRRIDCDAATDVADARFEYFINEVLPALRDSLRGRTTLYVSSYFDFVRLRNHFKRERISSVQMSEYTANKDISRSRTLFYHGRRQFMLTTERFYFYRRYRIRGMHNIVFYDPPTNPLFYPELINTMEPEVDASVTVLYTKFDGSRLERLVNKTRATTLITSPKTEFMFY